MPTSTHSAQFDGSLMKRAALILLAAAACPVTAAGKELSIIESREHFLGAPGAREWRDFDHRSPEARQLDVVFQSKRNATECALFIRQRDINLVWSVQL